MSFTSITFILYFPFLVIVYYLFPRRVRFFLLLISSYLFYLNVKPVYLLLLVGVTLSTYFFTIQISITRNERLKRMLMVTNVILILLPLLWFKYFGAIDQLLLQLLGSSLVGFGLPTISYILPVGISFYTFMAIGYTLDVYNENVDAEKNLGIVALFLSFFPLILSGPIERAGNMFNQFKNPKDVSYDAVVKGMKWMLWGYFMKLVVADRLGLYIDVVHNNYLSHNGTTLMFASLLYPIQVYGDLGGYSLIAIGAAKIMGYDVITNFRRPFFATSMSEFWNRWHISLISWLKDYLYTPVSFALRSYGKLGIIISLLITFIISGLWHGPSLTFIAWGLFQGVLVSIEAMSIRYRTSFESKFGRRPLYIFISCAVTFLLFSASLIFARSESISKAMEIYQRIFTTYGGIYLDITTLSCCGVAILILFVKDFIEEFRPEKLSFVYRRNIVLRFSGYLLITFMILLFGVFNQTKFIYFQF